MLPVARVRNSAEYQAFLSKPEAVTCFDFETGFAAAYDGQPMHLRRNCAVCDTERAMLVDMEWGGVERDGYRHPNWRERLTCDGCGLNNRQRLMASLVLAELANQPNGFVYFMEEVTPIIRVIREQCVGHYIFGSEYLGDMPSGTVVNGIRHEDVERLSFRDDDLSLIVSTDVMEHVPDPWRGFRECARVLRPGGQMFATFPMYPDCETSVVRARVTPDGIDHLKEPVYHGNPLSADGSLVFTDFGWDVVSRMVEAGFADVTADLYRSVPDGYLGGFQVVFRATKG